MNDYSANVKTMKTRGITDVAAIDRIEDWRQPRIYDLIVREREGEMEDEKKNNTVRIKYSNICS